MVIPARRRGGAAWGCGIAALALVLALAVPAPSSAGAEPEVAPFSNAVNLVPAQPAWGGCVPFVSNRGANASGFVYRNVPPFTLEPGTVFAFDLAEPLGADARQRIFFAHANKNPSPGDNDVRAVDWVQVVSEGQLPEHPRGNDVQGDYELRYTAETHFAFSGGGLVVGFDRVEMGSPHRYSLSSCADVVFAHGSQGDPSGHFFSRFWTGAAGMPEGNLVALASETTLIAGLVIFSESDREVGIAVLPGSPKNAVALSSRGVVPVAILSDADLDAPNEVDPASLTFGVTGTEPSWRGCRSVRDVDGDGHPDLVCMFDVQVGGFGPDTETAVLGGRLFDGTRIRGEDVVAVVGGRAQAPYSGRSFPSR